MEKQDVPFCAPFCAPEGNRAGSAAGTGGRLGTAAGALLAEEEDKRRLMGGALPEAFYVLITCRDERQQVELLGRFKAEGLDCKAVIG